MNFNFNLYKIDSSNLNEWEDLKFENKLTCLKKRIDQPNKKMTSIALLRKSNVSYGEDVFLKNVR
jgi:hypothetical protein